MKSPFFFAFSTLIAMAAVIPASSLANTLTAKAPSIQPEHPSLTAEGKRNDEAITGIKQIETLAPIFRDRPASGSWGNTPSDPFPLGTPQLELPPAPITTVTIHHQHRQAHTGHTDTYANYKTWNGSDWTASIDSSGEFIHTHRGENSGHTDRIIQYISWDGQPWTATVNTATNVFTHTRQGASSSHTDTILNYIGWDGSHWTMRLQS